MPASWCRGQRGTAFHFNALSFCRALQSANPVIGWRVMTTIGWKVATGVWPFTRISSRPIHFQRHRCQRGWAVWNERGTHLTSNSSALLSDGLVPPALGRTGVRHPDWIYLLRVQRLNLKQQALQKNRDLLESEVQKRTAELAKTNISLAGEIAEHKQAEMACWNRRRLSSLVTKRPPGFSQGPRRAFRRGQSGVCQLKGLSAEEILGKTPRELDDYERAREAAGLLKQPPRQRMLQRKARSAQTDHEHRGNHRSGGDLSPAGWHGGIFSCGQNAGL